jgi:hypothetical protein
LAFAQVSVGGEFKRFNAGIVNYSPLCKRNLAAAAAAAVTAAARSRALTTHGAWGLDWHLYGTRPVSDAGSQMSRDPKRASSYANIGREHAVFASRSCQLLGFNVNDIRRENPRDANDTFLPLE